MPEVTPEAVLRDLTDRGLRQVLNEALRRYRRDGQLGKSRPSLSADDWAALAALTGQVKQELDLKLVDEALRQSRFEVPLLEVLTALNGGPVQVARELRDVEQARWNDILESVQDEGWRELLERDEAGAKLIRAELRGGVPVPLVQRDLRVVSAALAQLRLGLSIRLPVLAQEASGDAHALDLNRLAGKLLAKAVEDLGLPGPERNGVASTVLVANLRGEAWLEGFRGRAVALPWREVMTLNHVETQTGQLYVVENHAVFEGLLDALGGEVSLLCSSGQPSAATMALLQRMNEDTKVQVSCDFDLGGLRIASRLLDLLGSRAEPWRMEAETYLAALQASGGFPLGSSVQGFAERFPDLVAKMTDHERGAHQEAVLAQLVGDVRRATP